MRSELTALTARAPETEEPAADAVRGPRKVAGGKSPNQEMTAAYEKAFNALNRDLFDGALPVTYETQRGGRKSGGHVLPGRWEGRGDDVYMEVALKPAEKGVGAEEILLRLVHQMLRVWQQSFGSKKPSRWNYHNSEFAEKAKEIGLEVSVPGGREGQVTGDRVELAVIEGGAFAKAGAKLVRGGWDVPLREVVELSPKENRGGKRMKLICPRCEDNVMTSTAEPECGRCRKETGEIYAMVEESSFLAEGAPWVLDDEERKALRAERRGQANGNGAALQEDRDE